MQAHLRIRPPHLLPIPPSKNTRKIDRETEREIETDREIERDRERERERERERKVDHQILYFTLLWKV